MFLDMSTISIKFLSGKEISLMKMRLTKKLPMFKNLWIKSWNVIGAAKIQLINSILSFRMKYMVMKVMSFMNTSEHYML